MSDSGFLPNDIVMGQPAWRMALLFPPQGSWTEQEYLALDARRLIELDQGCVEVFDTPTKEHQRIVRYLFLAFQSLLQTSRLGELFFAPLPVRLWEGKYREPDLVFVRHGRNDIGGYPDGADLVVEVVSDTPQDRRRDIEVKRGEYEKAGIGEYWIVDPQTATLSVCALVDGKYQVTDYTRDQTARSMQIDGLAVDVAAVFDAGEGRN